MNMAGSSKIESECMAVHLYPCSYRCDCGQECHFTEGTVREMERKSQGRRQLLADSGRAEHRIEFDCGRAVAVICPRLGRCAIGATG